MCGIFGIIRHDKNQILWEEGIQGLKKLKYRGHDSSGLGYLDERNRLYAFRELDIDKLKTLVEGNKQHKQNIIILHNRWSSHGKASIQNAHPIEGGKEKDVLLVHNGTIENYKELRSNLETLGYKFETETDTEVIAHLISLHLNDNNKIEDVFLKTNKLLKGTWSYAFISNKKPDTLYASCFGCPLFFSFNGYLSSDVQSLEDLTDDYEVMDDGDSLIVEYKEGRNPSIWYWNSKFQCKNFKNSKFKISQTKNKKENNNQDIILSEIEQQPELITNWKPLYHFDPYNVYGKPIILFGCGSSFNSALLGKKYLKDISKLNVDVQLASEFQFPAEPVNIKEGFAIAISQSGESADVKEVVELLEGKCICVTNNETSKIAQISDKVMLINCPKEYAVAATMSYTLTTLFLYSMARELSWLNNALVTLELELKILGEACQKVIEDPFIKDIAKQIYSFQHVFYLARNYNYPIACEGALKAKEIWSTFAEAMCSSEVKHGPVVLANDKLLSVVIVSEEGDKLQRVLSNISQLRSRGSKVLIICNEKDREAVYYYGDWIITVPNIGNKYLQPILMNIPCQLLAYWCGKLKGNNVDFPKGICKAVTIY